MAWEFLQKIQNTEATPDEIISCFMKEIEDYEEMPEVKESVIETLKEERPEVAAMLWGEDSLSDKQLANKFLNDLWTTRNHLKIIFDFQGLKTKRPGAVEIILKTTRKFNDAGVSFIA